MSAGLFAIGLYGVLARKSALLVLMSIELMLNAANVALIAFSRLHTDPAEQMTGQALVFFTITLAAAEVAVGLAIIVRLFRLKDNIDADRANLLRG